MIMLDIKFYYCSKKPFTSIHNQKYYYGSQLHCIKFIPDNLEMFLILATTYLERKILEIQLV